MAKGYVATGPFRLGSGDPESDEVTDFEAGDVVPGAAKLDNLDELVRSGRLAEQGSDAAETAVAGDGSDYDGFKVGDLRAALKERGLETSGRKADLIARLEADDAEGSA